MALGVCAYPKLKTKEYRLIQDFRKENDQLYYSLAEPHFSFVFLIEDIDKDQFMNEIYDKSNKVESIDFEIKCTVVNKDASLDYYHLLLVPDRGFSEIVKLHDRLYSELLFKHLRLDIDFIPHMGIANSKDKFKVKKWADDWNRNNFSIDGTIDSLTIVDYTNNVLTDLETIQLK